MCGISGVVAWGSATLPPGEPARKMVELMHYRGPDASDTFAEPGVELGSCRLAIVDVAGSPQPISSRDGRYVLVFNGEIYNFRELRSELQEQGLTGQTQGDAETVLLAHQHWGEDYLTHLEGMFAFALWDRETRTLRLARDRFGEKPVYVARDRQQLAFASEAKALLHAGFGRRAVNPEAIHHYLAFRAVPAPHTLFEGIEQIPPGHEWVIDAEGVRARRYYDLRRSPDPTRTPQEWAEGLRNELRRSVRQRLISDVPLGGLLSGGLDSTAVVAFMAEVSRPRTFFISFDTGERTRIDARYAREAAEVLGTEHRELQMTSEGLLRELPRILWHLESPSVDGYQYFYAYRLAKEEVTVALSGQGGDELFAGYGWFHQIMALERWRQLAHPLTGRGPTRVTASALTGALHRLGKARSAARLGGVLCGDSWLDSYCSVKSLFGDRERDELYREPVKQALHDVPSQRAVLASHLTGAEQWPLTERISKLQIKSDLCDILLRDTDAVSMANSLEVRLPLLDHHLVEYVLSIPSELKASGGEGKHIQRLALQGIVPQSILDRPKLGFSFPMAAWLKGPLRAVADVAFDPEVIERRGLFRVEPLRRYYRLFYEGQGTRTPFYVWCFVMLELWHRVFIDPPRPDSPPPIEELVAAPVP